MDASILLLIVAGVCAAVSAGCLFKCFREARARDSGRWRVREILSASDAATIKKSRKAARQRALDMERHVPEMVDALALCMRSGMSFERAFRCYCFRFDDELALACRKACLSWESGLVSRDTALQGMAQESGVAMLDRLVANCIRCMKFGSPMNRMFDAMAAEARACYRSKMEEKVAKTPVKMLIPTAALILPAMLILVMAPVLLEFVG